MNSDYELIEVTDDAGLAVCKAIRRRVFIDEQGVEESLEIDGYDILGGKCRHYYVLAGGIPAAACRVTDKGEGIAKLQRFCVLPEFRSAGLGRFMLEKLEDICRDGNFGRMEMGAQCHAAPFYEKCGYRVVSDVFMDAGIEHVKMEKRL